MIKTVRRQFINVILVDVYIYLFDYFLANPPPSKHIELLCFIFPRRPWCRPRIKLLSSPESVELESSNDWFIAGIFRDYNYNLLKDKYCNSTLTPQKDEQFVTTTKDLFQKFTTTQNF
jgi:hypothetical protein